MSSLFSPLGEVSRNAPEGFLAASSESSAPHFNPHLPSVSSVDTSPSGEDEVGHALNSCAVLPISRFLAEGIPMIFILNLLWLILGGWLMGLGWILAGVIMAITIVGLPWARSCFMIARYSFWPFGYDIVSRDEVNGRSDMGTGTLGTIGNVIWFIFAGWWLALAHLSLAVGLAFTIIGIPFAWAHVKLAMASLFPVGKTVVAVDDFSLLGHRLNQAPRG